MATSDPPPTPILRSVWIPAAVYLVLHLLPRPGYGFHRDELLYLAMADHLDPLRMQFPPLIAVLGRVAQLLPGPTLWGTRLLAALAGTALLLTVVALTRRLGGGREAQILAGLAVMASPFLLRIGALFQPVVFENLWWALALLACASLLDGGDRRWWLAFGAAAGMAGLTKFSAAVFGLAMAAGVLASPLRRDFLTRWPWLAVAVGATLALPSVLGQVAWGWPFFAQAEVLRATQLQRVSASSFLVGQLFLAFAAAPLLVLGAAGLAAAPALRAFRALGVAALAALLAFLILGGKEYYFGPMHPVLLAAGSVLAGGWLAGRPALWRGALTWGVVGVVVVLPLGIPLLPPALTARYSAALGITRAVTTNRGTVLPLPQDYADMLGWREQAEAVARVVRALPPEEQGRVTLVGGNYGRAGALAVYHQELGLPYPVSRHGDFYAWGPGEPEPSAVIIVGGTMEELSLLFGRVEEAARVLNPMGVEEEQDVPIHVCRDPLEPLPRMWTRLGVVWG